MRFSDEGWATEHQAIVMKQHPKARAIISAFSLGELSPSGVGPWAPADQIPWRLHSEWFNGIFLSKAGFGLKPAITVQGSPYVMADQRTSVFPGLLSLR